MFDPLPRVMIVNVTRTKTRTATINIRHWRIKGAAITGSWDGCCLIIRFDERARFNAALSDKHQMECNASNDPHRGTGGGRKPLERGFQIYETPTPLEKLAIEAGFRLEFRLIFSKHFVQGRDQQWNWRVGIFLEIRKWICSRKGHAFAQRLSSYRMY